MHHHAAKASEPLFLRRARRLQRRLGQLVQRDPSPNLLRHTWRDLRDLSVHFEELKAFIDAGVSVDAYEVLDVVSDCVSRSSDGLRDQRLQRWRADLRQSFAKQCRWVKDRADLKVARAVDAPSLDCALSNSLHPSTVLDQETLKWSRLWTSSPSSASARARLQQVVDSLPQVAQQAFEPDLSAQALRRSVHAMRRKSPGPDGFKASSLELFRLSGGTRD